MVPQTFITEDSAALAALFDSLLPAIGPTVGWACRQYRQYPAPDVINDLTQEVILSLLQNDAQKLRSFDYRATEKTWLRVVVRHQVGRYFKRQKPTESLEYLSEAALPRQLPEQEEKTLRRERRELLAKIQAQLTDREQELLGRLGEGLRDEEIAVCMGIQVRSIQRTKCRLFQKVKTALCNNALKEALNH